MQRSFIRRGWLVPILLTALAAATRFWALDRIPPGLHYDEAFEALEAWRVLRQPGYHPIFFPGNFGVEPLFIYLTALGFRIFGETPAVMRGVAALIGTLTVPALYGLGLELRRAEPRLPRDLPWLAALTLAILPWHVLFSRTGIEPILVPLGVVGLCWAFWWALRTRRVRAWLLLGVTAGLGAYMYPAGRLLFVLLLALPALVWLTDRPRLQGCGRGLRLAVLAAAIVMAPLAWHFAGHPEQLVLRSQQISVVAGQAPAGGLAQNAPAVLGMFSVRGDADPRNNLPGAPVLNIWLSLAFYLGLGLALWHWRRPVYASLPLAGLVMLLPTLLSEYAPHFRRSLGAAPGVALLCGLGLAAVLSLGTARAQRRDLPAAANRGLLARLARSPVVRAALVAAVLLASARLTALDYFERWGSSPDLYYAYDEGLWEIGRYAAGLPAGRQVYISPRPAGDATLAFAWRDGPAVRHFDGREGFLAPAYPPAAGLPATYVIIDHEDRQGARVLHDLYPQAQEVKRFLDRGGHVYARAFYVADTGTTQRRPMAEVQAAWPNAMLTGYDLDQPVYHPGDIIELNLWWRATGTTAADWTVFTHLVGPAHPGPEGTTTTLWAGDDDRPASGGAPTGAWQPGDLVLDQHHIRIPSDAPPGVYDLEVGLYDLTHGTRGRLRDPAGQDHVVIGQIDLP